MNSQLNGDGKGKCALNIGPQVSAGEGSVLRAGSRVTRRCAQDWPTAQAVVTKLDETDEVEGAMIHAPSDHKKPGGGGGGFLRKLLRKLRAALPVVLGIGLLAGVGLYIRRRYMEGKGSGPLLPFFSTNPYALGTSAEKHVV